MTGTSPAWGRRRAPVSASAAGGAAPAPACACAGWPRAPRLLAAAVAVAVAAVVQVLRYGCRRGGRRQRGEKSARRLMCTVVAVVAAAVRGHGHGHGWQARNSAGGWQRERKWMSKVKQRRWRQRDGQRWLEDGTVAGGRDGLRKRGTPWPKRMRQKGVQSLWRWRRGEAWDGRGRCRRAERRG